MDLESYIGRYSGETRLRRLISIAQRRCSNGNSNSDSDNLINLRRRALDLAEHQMKRDSNVQLYRRIFANGGNNGRVEGGRIVDEDLFDGRPPLDVNWMNSTESTNRETRHILEGRLSTAQSRLHKDAIRTGYLALAEHDIRVGRDIEIAPPPVDVTHHNDDDNGKDSSNNNKSKNVANVKENNSFANINGSLFRAMDFSTSKLQTAQIGLLILESALNAGNFVVVRDYADRTESTLKSFKSSNSNTNSTKNNTNNDTNIARGIGVKVQIAKGIERMVAKDYKTAANILVPLVINGYSDGDDRNSNSNSGDTTTNMEQHELHMLHWPGVTSPEDVALYAGLLCLVTRDRSRMMALADDPEALALVPAVKELLVHYFRCQYEPCMLAISGIHGTSSSSTTAIGLSQPLLPLGLVIDVYLTPERWSTLVQTIRENCVVEYLRPYQRVKLENLNNLFFPLNDKTVDDNTPNLDPVIDTLLDLMDRKLLPSTTRLDCREQILFQVPPLENPSSSINLMEEHIMDDSHAMMVRLACLEHDLVYHDPSAAVGAFGGGRRGHKTAMRSGRRYQQPQHKSRGGLRFGGSSAMAEGVMMVDSSDDDDDDDGVAAYFDSVDELQHAGGDTHMADAEAPAHPAAMNPEDMY